MPPKRKKSAARGKKKKPAEFVDPDEPYRVSLDEMHYISQQGRSVLNASHRERINASIEAFTLAQPPLDLEKLSSQAKKEPAMIISMQVIPYIIRSLGLNLTDKQIRQVGWIVLCRDEKRKEEEEKQQQPAKQGKEKQKKGSLKPAKKAREEYESSVTSDEFKLSLEEMMRLPFLDMVEQAAENGKEMMADRIKLEAVLLDILRTGLLVFDPAAITPNETSNSEFERVVSVVKEIDPEVVENVFDALWSASPRHTCSDGVRYIYGSDLVRLLDAVNDTSDIGEPPMTKDELNALLFFVREMGSDTIREDSFAWMAL